MVDGLDQVKTILSPVGNLIATGFSKIITFIANLSLNISDNQVKIIALIIFVGGLGLVAKFFASIKKPLNWILAVLLAILIISIIFSF